MTDLPAAAEGTKKENDAANTSSQAQPASIPSGPPELDEWGLPIRHLPPPIRTNSSSESDKGSSSPSPALERPTLGTRHNGSSKLSITSVHSEVERIEALRRESVERARNARRGSQDVREDSDDEDFKNAVETQAPKKEVKEVVEVEKKDVEEAIERIKKHKVEEAAQVITAAAHTVPMVETVKTITQEGNAPEKENTQADREATEAPAPGLKDRADDLSEQLAAAAAAEKTQRGGTDSTDITAESSRGHARHISTASQQDGAAHKAIFSSSNGGKVSEWSHQAPMAKEEKKVVEEEDEWQEMPSYAPYDIYDDDNKLIAKEAHESDDEAAAYGGLGGAGKGYTRVQLDEDAQSATSMDENTNYLFKDAHGTSAARGHLDEDDEVRDAVSQLQATKDLLTEGQRIAYVGMTRLVLSNMVKKSQMLEKVCGKGAKKETGMGTEAMRMWSQKMMIRLYAHMDISAAEQIMIEQLAEHGVVPEDLTETLMANARVKNPMAEGSEEAKVRNSSVKSPRPSSIKSPRPSTTSVPYVEEKAASPPPAYEEVDGEHLPEVRTPSQLPSTENIDIDLRWTILCDLFLTLIVDSIYDSRSRKLLEEVGSHLDISWLDICRFEKRVTDALEMQQAAEKENWNEDEHLEARRKMALTKRYVMMGLATVGGGLVIGLSGGLAAPIIGAGLAAGFTTIGVAGTSAALTSVAAAGIIGTAAATTGSVIGVRAANRRTGAVKTFEYRPLHNNKRVNLIVTVSGWMTGKVDDVRLPYSTVDPIMGDIYSVLWEPEMLQSMGATINILATEALTQGLQQALAAGLLTTLMGALQLPLILTKLSYLIDNPWSVSVARADAAGLILADSLIDRNLGTRPITFVGYSLGSRVIYSCLRELSRRGAHGLVQNVYLFGTPVVATKDDYLKARSVVSGRFVNGYATNDWILGYLFRLTSGGISRVAGLAAVDDIPDLENVDVTKLVPGHMAYRQAMPKLLKEVGWLVDSEDFNEIEDPDPENHEQRQRELINEIEEARREFERQEQEKGGKGGKFSWLKKKKKKAVGKKEWETYEKNDSNGSGRGSEEASLRDRNDFVLFDIDAIRKELESENYEVKELPSTLPPMKIVLNAPTPSTQTSPAHRSGFRTTKSADAVPTTKQSYEYDYDETADQEENQQPPVPTQHKPRKSYTYAGGVDDAYRQYHASPFVPEEPEIAMSFDTAYVSPAPSTPNPGSASAIRTDSHAHPQASSLRPDSSVWGDRAMEVSARNSRDMREEDPWAKKDDVPAPSTERPPLTSACTTPVLRQGQDKNAWADDYDDDEFKEKEVTMTFG